MIEAILCFMLSALCGIGYELRQIRLALNSVSKS